MTGLPDPDQPDIPDPCDDGQGSEAVDNQLRGGKAPRRFSVESLEPRILMSATWVEAEVGEEALAAAIGDGAEDPLDGLEGEAVLFGDGELAVVLPGLGVGGEASDLGEVHVTLPGLAPTGDGFTAGALGEDGGRTAVVFIDSSVPDLDSLVADLDAQIEEGRDLEYVVIGADEDGIATVSDTLAGMDGVDAVHIVSHGEEGAAILGTSELDGASLTARAEEIAAWGQSLDADGDLVLYGCDLAADAEGEAFLTQLAALTQADVAASDDDTGGGEGDWDFEREVGDVEADVVFSEEIQDTYTGTFAVDVSPPLLDILPGVGQATGSGIELVAHWEITESEGATTFADSIGANDGSSMAAVSGDVQVVGGGGYDSGSAVSFDSADQSYIEVAHSPELKPDNGALSLWINPEHTSGANALASSDSSGYDTGGHISVWVDSGQIEVRIQSESGSTTTSGGSVNANEWQHVAVTWGGDGLRVYLDGVEVASNSSWTSGLGGNEEPWTFGACQASSGNLVANNLVDFYDGQMDDIALYGEQLTVDQIGQLFNSGVDGLEAASGQTEYPLGITTSVVEPDGTETLSVTVSDLPDGAVLSAGTDNGDGTWTLAAGELDGLSVTVPGDGTSASSLVVTSTVTDGDGDQASRSVTVTFGDANIVAEHVTGTEDGGAIDLDIAVEPTDPGDSISGITIAGLPSGASLSAGIDNGDGTWTVSEGELSSLQFVAADDYAGTVNLTVTATTTDGAVDETTVATFQVAIVSVADVPTLTGSSGLPQAITSSGTAPVAHWEISESEGATTFADSIGANDGSSMAAVSGDVQVVAGGGYDSGSAVSFDSADQSYIEVAHSPELKPDNGALSLWINPEHTSGANALASSDSSGYDTGGHISVWVDSGQIEVRIQSESGSTTTSGGSVNANEWQHVAVTWGGDGLRVYLDGVEVASNSSWTSGLGGNEEPWTFGACQASSGNLVANNLVDFYDGQMDDIALYGEQLTVEQIGEIVTSGVSGLSGGDMVGYDFELAAASTDADGSEALAITVSGLPTGGALSAGTDNGDGTWTLTTGDLTGLQLTVPEDAPAWFDVDVTSTATDIGGDEASASTTVRFGPDLTATDAVGVEDSPIALGIDLVQASAGYEVVVSGVPSGATLSAGIDNGDGSWTVATADAESLILTPPTDSSADFDLTVTLQRTSDQAEVRSATLRVEVAAVADAASLTANDVSGSEDSAIALDLGASVTDGSETITSIKVTGVPSGASLSAGVDNGDGTWTVEAADLGSLGFTAPSNFSGTVSLGLEVVTTDGADTETTTDSFTVTVAAVADAASLTANDVSGSEDTAIALDLGASVTDGSETITSIKVTGVPSGSSLSAGVDNGDGTWTVGTADLGSLEFTPATNFSGTVNLGLEVVTTDGTDTETTTDSFTVTVAAVADAAALTANDVSGSEDSAIALDLGASVTDGSETITSVKVTGVPSGASLSAGVDNGDGTWTVGTADLGSLEFTPATNYSGTVNLGLEVVTTDGADTETATDSFTVTVAAVADAASLTANDVSGSEDSAIALDLGASVTDGSETITSVKVTGVPTGAALSAGVDNGDGTWTVGTADLGSLEFTPATNFSGTVNLGLEVVTTDGADTETTTDSFTVTVAAVADAASLTANDVSGSEDSAIALDLGASVTDGSETITSVKVTGVPSGAALSAGVDNGDGTWTVGTADLGSLEFTPATNFSGTVNLGLEVVTTDGADTETATDSFTVTVDPVADTASLTANDVSGSEDSAIALDLGASVTDGSEAITSVKVTGVPSGASLSAGVDNGDGTWTIDSADLGSLQFTPATNISGTVNLGLEVVTTDGADTETATDSFTVTVAAVADAAVLTANDVSGSEDGAIALDLGASVTDGSEAITSIKVTGVPSGASLSAGVDNGDGTWTIDSADLGSLEFTAPTNFSGTVNLGLEVVTTDGTDTETTTDSFTVTVAAVADAAALTANDVSGSEDGAIALDLGASVTDGSEAITSIKVTGVPSGASLSAGVDNGDGTWTVGTADLGSLEFTPATNFSGTVNLGLEVVTTDGADTETTTDSFTVTVDPVADAASLTANDVSGSEDSAIALDLGASVTDGSETITSIMVTGVPSGASLSAGVDNGDGTWTIDSADLGSLEFTPATNISGTVNLGLEVVTTDGADTETATDSFTVTVAAVADAAVLTANDVSGSEDGAIALDLGASVTDGSEAITSIKVTGVPSGSSLSAGVDNGDGTWTIDSADLGSLEFTAPTNFSGTVNLGLEVVTTDGTDTETTTDSFTVTVAAVADAAALTANDVSGSEDGAIALDLGASVTDGSEAITSIKVTGVPSGASLSAGVDNGDGTWTVGTADLGSLEFTPATNFSGTVNLGLEVVTTDGADIETTTDSFTVTVDPVADAASLTANDVSGSEDSAIALDLGASVTDGSETITSIMVTGVPSGASLSAGVDNGDGTWTIDSADLGSLEFTAATNFSGTVSLGLEVVTTDGADTETATASFTVTVDPVADAASLTANDVSGSEDSAIALDLGASVTDGSETITSVKVTGVPSGASLSAGVDNGDGTWTVGTADLASLEFTPATNFSGSVNLGLEVVTTDGADTETATDTFTVTVAAVADAASLTANDVSGSEDSAIALDLGASVTDGSETITSIKVTGVPSGASLSAGVDNGDGTWTVGTADLGSLEFTPATNFSGSVNLGLEVVTTDGADTETTTDSFSVTVAAVADAASLTANDVSGSEDSAIALDLSASVTDGSETITSIEVTGVPSGASLSAGVDNGDGTWTVGTADLGSLEFTPDTNFSGTVNLGLEVVTTDGADTETATASFTVTVDPVADAASLTANDVSGSEDSAIALDLGASVTDGSETITSVKVTGVPSGASLSAGVDNGDGTWTVGTADLGSLQFTPATNYSGTVNLGLEVVTTDGTDTETATDSFTITVDPVADAASLTANDVSGSEDSAIALDLGASVTDGSETITSIKVTGVPSGASLSAGVDNGDGTWTIDSADLGSLEFTAPTNFSGTVNLGLEVVTTDGADTETATDTFTVTVAAVADAASLTANDVSGSEDSAIALDLGASVTDGSETITSIMVTGVPSGSSLSAGVDNGDGTWTIEAADLDSLEFTAPTNFSGTVNLGLEVVTKDGTDTETTTDSFTVTVGPVADAASLTANDVSGSEDSAVALDLGASVTDGSEAITSIKVTGVPSGASLSAGVDNGDGTWTVGTADLGSLEFTPATNYSGTVNLGLEVVTTDGTDTETATDSFTVTVAAVADAASLTANDVSGSEDSAIALDLGASVTDGSETITSVKVTGVPSGAALSAGVDNGDGTWTVGTADLGSLEFTPATNYSGTVNLGLEVVTTDGTDTETATDSFSVTVDPVADTASLTANDVSGSEDGAIALDLGASVTDGSETITSIKVTGVPSGAALSAGVDNGDGTWTVGTADLGSLEFTPATNYSGTVNLGLEVVTTDGTDAETTTDSFTVTVAAVADAASLTANDVSGSEDSAIALDLGASVTDGSEAITSIKVTGVPSGSSLSAGVDNGDGTWTIDSADLGSLEFTAATNFSGTVNLGLEVVTTDGADTETTTDSFTVTVAAVADAASLTANDVSGSEDSAIALDLGASVTDGSEAITSIKVTGVPSGASLSAGVDNGDGTWTVGTADLGSLEFSPATNFSGTVNLGLEVVTTDGADTETTTDSFTVTVDPVADAASLTANDVSGSEDSAIALDLGASVTDGSETITSIMVTGVPSGASLSAGVDNGDGTWTIDSADLGSLEFTAATNFSGTVSLGLEVVTTDGADTETATESFTVTVAAVADAASLTANDVSGSEDSAIALDLGASVTDGSEIITSVRVTGVPSGALLSAGVDNGDGTWTVEAADLGSLEFTPATNYSGTVNLGLEVVTTDGADTETATDSFTVTVDPVADAASVTANDVSGSEDSAIDLDLGASVTDGSETITSIKVTGVPSGSSLSAGVDNGDGTWTVEAADLGGLQFTPATNFSGTVNLDLEVVTTDGADTETTTDSFTVTVAAVADAASLTANDVSGSEDSAIALDLSASVTDGSETITSIMVTGVPSGASLSAGVDNGDGTWTVGTADLGSLQFTPATNFSGTVNLGLEVVTTDGADTETATDSFTVTVAAVADAAALTANDVSGSEDSAIALDLGASVTDGSETITSIKVTSVPSGASLSAGVDNGDGTWTVGTADLGSLEFTPATNFSGSVNLGLEVVTTDGADTETTTDSFSVTVAAVADAASLTANDVSGSEDSAIALDLSASVTDGSETITPIEVTGVPSGASLSAGVDNGDGTWTVGTADLGSLEFTPDTNFSGTVNLGLEVITTDGADTETTTDSFTVTVAGVADAASLTANDVSGSEDSAIALDLSASVTDGSEIITSVRVTGVPSGALLSAGVDNGDGTWTVETADLGSLEFTPATNYSGTVNLGIEVVTTDGTDTETTTDSFTVTVAAVADAASLTANDVSGSEDSAIALDLGASATDGSETITSINVTGVPSGASLSAGVDNGDGTWTVGTADLGSLEFTPATNYSGTVNLGLEVVTTDGTDTETTTDSFTVTVAAVADAASLTANDVSGSEDSAIALDLEASLTDGSEAITSIKVTGVPSGASLSAGVDNGDGTWTVEAADLGSLEFTAPTNFSGTVNLGLEVVTTDGTDTETATDSFTVTVDPVADTASLTVNDVSGSEDSAIALDLEASVTDGSETITSVKVTGVPSGAELSAGVDNGDGTWTVGTADLGSLEFTPATNYSGTVNLGIEVVTTDGTDSETTTDSFTVTVAAVADAAALTANDVSGSEDSAIALDLGASVTDGSETITSIKVTGVPSGASLSAGVDNGDGTWTIDSADLGSLEFTASTNFSGTVNLGLEVVTTDGADTETATDTFTVTVAAVADAASLTANDVSGSEDSAIALDLSASVTDGSETITSIKVTGVPSGSSLSAGVDNGDGTWTVGTADLGSLQFTPATNYSGTVILGLEVVTTDGADTETTTDSFTVTVDPVADAASLTANDVSGSEDSAIALDLGASVTDGSETITSVKVTGVPSGAALSAGVDNGDGTWTVGTADLASLEFTPATNFSGTVNLGLEVVTTDGTDTETTTDSFTVTVDPVADTASLTANDVSGSEDSAIALDLGASVTDGSETITSIKVTGVPSGSSLSAGVDNGDGTWTIEAADLGSLEFTPATNFSGTVNLGLEVVTTDGPDTETATDSFTVTVDPVADAASLTANDVSGSEDSAIALDLGASVTDGSETITSIKVTGVPSGASLSAGVDNGDGTWTVGTADLGSLEFTPATNFSGSVNLGLEVVTTDGADTETTTDSFSVTVVAVADAASLTANDVSGSEDSAIALDLGASVTDGSETITSVKVTGVPSGAALSAGFDNGDGTWTVGTADLGSLKFTPATNYSGTVNLGLEVVTTDGTDTETTTDSFTVTVAAVADAASLTANDVSGSEDSAITLDLGASVTDVSETITSVKVTGVPSGALLSAGVDNGDGTWTVEAADLGSLEFTPATNFSGTVNLGLEVVTTDGADTETATDSFTVTVDPVADAASLTANDVSGSEDSAIALDLGASVADVSETITSVKVTGVPSGALLSAGVDNGDGTWTVGTADLASLEFTPATNFSGTVNLGLEVVTTDGTDTETATDSFTVTVDPVADAASLTANDVSGSEDSAIALDLGASVADVSETITSVKVTGVPSGALLSAGVDNGDGTWTVGTADLASLEFTPATNFSGTVNLGLEVVTTDGTDTETTTDSFTVTVAAVADAASLTANDVSGSEDSAITLDLGASVTDVSETITSVKVTGVPSGALLSAGVDNGDGTWTVEAADLGSLEFTPATNFSGTVNLGLEVVTTDGADTETTTDSFTVTVDPVADAASLTANDVSGSEDSAIALDLGASVTDGSETITSVKVTGVPSGASLSAGVDNGDGTWTVGTADLGSLEFTPATNFSGSVNLGLEVVTTDGADTETATDSFTVTVDPVADAASLTANDVSGSEDSAIALDLGASVTDGSETITSVKVTGVPSGAALSAGVDNGDGTWTVEAADLGAIEFTPATNFSGTVNLGLEVVTTDGADTETATDSFTVTVDPVADAASLTANDVSGSEDSTIALDLGASVTDGSETITSIKVTGVPSGSSLSAGVDNGDGTWTIDSADLASLEFTPATNFSGTVNLGLEVVTTDGADTKMSTASFQVIVDAVADGIELTTESSHGIAGQAIDLHLSVFELDRDSSETHQVIVGGLPDGYSLSAGERLQDGRWSVAPGELDGLQILTDSSYSSIEFQLAVSVRSIDGASTVERLGGLVQVTVDPVDLEIEEAPTVADDEPEDQPADVANEPAWFSEEPDQDLYAGVSFERSDFSADEEREVDTLDDRQAPIVAGLQSAAPAQATRLELPDPTEGFLHLFSLDAAAADVLQVEAQEEAKGERPPDWELALDREAVSETELEAKEQKAGLWTLMAGMFRNLTSSIAPVKNDSKNKR